jgi:formylglycine-generating enzyme required for sulfatase activity
MSMHSTTLRALLTGVSIVAFSTHSGAADASFEDWLVSNGIPPVSSGPEDRNGPLMLTNLEAYAYGLNPFSAVKTDLPRITEADTVTGLKYFYRQNTDAADIVTGLEGSTNLAGFDAITPASESVLWTIDGVEGREAVITWGGASPQFLRFSATFILPPAWASVDIAAGTIPEFGGFLKEITITQPYSIGVYEVTGAEWQEVADWAVSNGYTDIGVGSNPIPPTDYCNDTHPVQGVDWYQVVKYCNARSEKEGLEPVYYISGGGVVYRTGEYGQCGSLAISWDSTKNGYRLPTRAEWEYAARGGQSTNNYIYSGSNTLDDVAWHSANSFGAECDLSFASDGRGTWPVGTKAPNELGLYDMTGNVYEWHWDPNIVDDPLAICDVGEAGARSASGGSWLFPADPIVDGHTNYQPTQSAIWLGFRLARNQYIPD